MKRKMKQVLGFIVMVMLVFQMICSSMPVEVKAETENGKIIYVKADAPEGGDGTTWGKAYNDLQQALEKAREDKEVKQIWIAKGTYKPTTDPNDRAASFQMINGVAIYGGFAGVDGERIEDRDIEGNKTILSGEIGNPNKSNDNTYQVIYNENINSTAILDGVTISGGYGGGGIYNVDSSPTLTNVTISGNEAGFDGGGMNNYNSSPTLTNVTISGNKALWDGGGMYNYDSSSPSMTNVEIIGNTVRYRGGGMNNYNSSPTLTNVTISGNKGDDGGGIYNQDSSPTLTNVTISGNEAGYIGGGMYNFNSSPTMTNVAIIGNTALDHGGGIYNADINTVTLTNVNIIGNNAKSGGGIYCWRYYSGTTYIRNSIIVGNNGGTIEGNNLIITHSLMDEEENIKLYDESGTSSEGKYLMTEIFRDPKMNDPLKGDYRLKPGSPAIDRGDSSLNNTEKDLDGKPRKRGASIDLGVYEFQVSSVIYDGNGATSGLPPVDSYYEKGDLVKVVGNSGNLKRPGYKFIGWNTQADGNGTSYKESDEFEIGEEDVTLYAQWEKWEPIVSVTMTSNNVKDSAKAKVGDKITLEMETNEAIQNPIVTIGNERISMDAQGDDQHWKAEYDVTENDRNDFLAFKIEFEDTVGNLGEPVTAVTLGTAVKIDTKKPEVIKVTMESNNNKDQTKAKVGDTITLEIETNEAIDEPTVTIAGESIDQLDGEGQHWTAKYEIKHDVKVEDNHFIPFTIDFEDLAGNIGEQVTAVTSGTAVKLDKTPPTITISGVENNQTYRQVTPIITTDEEATVTPILTRNGTEVSFESGTVINQPGNYVLTVQATDVVGNTTSVTVTFKILSSSSSGSGSSGGSTQPTEPTQETPQPTDSMPVTPSKENNEVIKQAPYIKGYPDGTFRPNAPVTRAQIASMLARFLTNGNIPLAEATFTDTTNHDAKDAIEYVKTTGLFKGKTESSFDPNGTITRAQMAAVVARWIEKICAEDPTKSYCTATGQAKNFTDVSATHWAYEAIQKVSALGIMTGNSETTFNPEGNLTRAQAVKVLNRLFEREPVEYITQPTFSDVGLDHWAIGEIEAAATERVVEK